MTLTHRRLLYILFFLIFFIAAPVVIFWAEGYRYDFKRQRLLKTGVLFLESNPSKAEIYLNNKLQTDTTTARFKNLLPDNYQVKIKKDGYQTWAKNLEIHPGETTFAQYVRLFKQDPEIKNILTENVILTSSAINNSVVLIYKNLSMYSLAILNLDDESLINLTDLKFKPTYLELSSSKSFVQLNYGNQILIYDVENDKLINLSNIVSGDVVDINWSDDQRDETVYTLTNFSVYKINLLSQSATKLLNKKIASFFITGDQVYYLEKSANNYLLKKSNLNNLDEFEIVTSLPISDDYKFYASPTEFLTLLDQQNQILYLIKTQTAEDKITILSETQFATWNENILLYGNAFEIKTFDFEKDEQKIIVRLGMPIKKALWYPVPTHILYLVNDELKAIESISGDRMLNTLISQENIQNVFINSDGNLLYFINADGLNLVEIQ